jgi:hypothetical protein
MTLADQSLASTLDFSQDERPSGTALSEERDMSRDGSYSTEPDGQQRDEAPRADDNPCLPDHGFPLILPRSCQSLDRE